MTLGVKWEVLCFIVFMGTDSLVFNFVYDHMVAEKNKEHSESAHLCQFQNLNQKWSDIWIWIFGLIGIGSRCPLDVVDALSCRHQSFRQVRYKSAVDCKRNANKCPKIPDSAMVKKMKKWSWIDTWILITTETQPLLDGQPLPVPAKFGRRPFPHLSVILFTEWHTDRYNCHMTCVLLAAVINSNTHNMNKYYRCCSWAVNVYKSAVCYTRLWWMWTKDVKTWFFPQLVPV